GGLARKPALGHGPLHDAEEIHSSRGEVGRRHEGDVTAAGSLVDLVALAAEAHVPRVAAAWYLVEVLVPDHDLRATWLGDPVDPDVIGDVIDADVRTRLGKATGNRVKRTDGHAVIISVDVRIGFDGAVALLVVHLRNDIPIVVGPRRESRRAW